MKIATNELDVLCCFRHALVEARIKRSISRENRFVKMFISITKKHDWAL